MSSQGWENTSRYIKRKIFGKNFSQKLKDLIHNGSPWDQENLLIWQVRAMADIYSFHTKKFIAESDEMYQELIAGKLSLKQMSTNICREINLIIKQSNEHFQIIRKLADALNVRTLRKRDSGDAMPESEDFIEYDAAAIVEAISLGIISIDDLEPPFRRR